MDPIERHYMDLTRRRFFGRCATGAVGALGFSALSELLAASPASAASSTGVHYRPKAKRVICMHMEGAPSQLDLWDYKPQLRKRFDQDLPDSVRDGQRLTGMTKGKPQLVLPSRARFRPRGESGIEISDWIPHIGGVADRIALVRSMVTDQINHAPAMTQFLTGNQLPGRPSLGAWTSYGLGNVNANLPAFVVLITQGFVVVRRMTHASRVGASRVRSEGGGAARFQ